MMKLLIQVYTSLTIFSHIFSATKNRNKDSFSFQRGLIKTDLHIFKDIGEKIA